MSKNIIDDILDGSIANQFSTPSKEMQDAIIKLNDSILRLRETLNCEQEGLFSQLLEYQAEYDRICAREYADRGYRLCLRLINI